MDWEKQALLNMVTGLMSYVAGLSPEETDEFWSSPRGKNTGIPGKNTGIPATPGEVHGIIGMLITFQLDRL